MEALRELWPDWLPPWLVAAAGGMLLSSWERVRSFLTRLSTHLIDIVKLDAELSAELMGQLGATSKVSRFGGKGFTVMSHYYRPARKQQWLLARWLDPKGKMTFWWPKPEGMWWYPFTNIPVWVDRGESGTQMTFRFFRATFPIETLLRDMLDRINRKGSDRYRLIRISGRAPSSNGENAHHRDVGASSFTRLPATSFLIGVDPKDIGEPKHQGGPEDLYLASEVRDVLQDARKWYNSRAWYQERGLPWRRGYLLHGLPGTGKTSLARAIGIDLDLPIYSLDLGSMTSAQLGEAFDQARHDAPCMVLLEDFDSVYRGRLPLSPNVQLGTPPTFDQVLNQIQGVGSNDGVVVFITTNHIDTVDQALGGAAVTEDDKVTTLNEPRPRPGRIDRMIKTPDYVDREGRIQLARKMMPDADWGDLIDSTEGHTPAQYHEALLQRALFLTPPDPVEDSGSPTKPLE